VRLVEDLDRRIVAREADARDLAGVQAVVDEGVAEFGRLDIVSANAASPRSRRTPGRSPRSSGRR
jgi:NAD(P)-dependent dehydrogenase (short-subunit alcohol dehydrogenase family)